MKFIGLVFIFTLTTCSQNLTDSLTPLSDEQVKFRVTALVEKQRRNKDWMKSEACPANKMPHQGRRPQSENGACAKNPEKCLANCDSGDGDSCYALAQLIQKQDKIENDVADVLYGRSCELGIVSGCTNRAANILEIGDEKSNKCAARTLERGCEQSDPWACTMFGLLLMDGSGVQKDAARAKQVLDKACEVSVDRAGDACARAGELKKVLENKENLD